MNLRKTAIASIFIVILIILSVTVLFGSSEEQLQTNASISGHVYDKEFQIGIINEHCVVLNKRSEFMELQRFWPSDPSNRGYYEFVNLTPGQYSIHLARSWVKVTLGDPDDKYLEGGWISPGHIDIDVKAGASVVHDIHLDFYAAQNWTGSIDGLRLQSESGTLFGYSADDYLGDNSNLIGKTMTIEVSWSNSHITRSDFSIDIMDLYSSEQTNYDEGPQVEMISITLDEAFFKYEDDCNISDWMISVSSIPSPETSDIPYSIHWTIE